MEPLVSLIILHFNKKEYTRNVIRALNSIDISIPIETIILDNGSLEPYTHCDSTCNYVVKRIERNAGFASACNYAARIAKGSYFFFLNNDIDFSCDFISPLITEIENDPKIGIIAPQLIHIDGRFQLSYGENPSLFSEFLERRRQKQSKTGKGSEYEKRARASRAPLDVDWVTGAALLISRQTFERIRGFDEKYYFYFEDADLCRRVRQAGFRIRYHSSVQIIHFGGGSDPLVNAEIVRSYRLGQVRYYSKFNSRISFYCLKLILLSRIIFMPIDSKISRPFRGSLIKEIFKYPYLRSK